MLNIGAVYGRFKIYLTIVLRRGSAAGERATKSAVRRLSCGGFRPEEATMLRSRPKQPDDKQKPGKPKGLPGLLIYGALTILGALALVVVAE